MHRLCIGAVTFAYSITVGAASLTAERVLAVAAEKGEQVALESFFACDPTGEQAYALVASGDTKWLNVAVRLVPFADSCYMSFLLDAIARALVPAPSKVLHLVDSSPNLPASRICVPFLSDEIPAAKHRKYLLRVERSIRTVHQPHLQSARQACLSEIERHRGYLKK
jgi:hypothetical protein